MTQVDSMLDDVGLLRRYATQRDAAAFAELVRRYADFVYATARRMTGSAALAEDVSQDCFLRLAQASASITGSVAAWLHRTSVNRSLEIMRSDRARAHREVESARQQAAIEPAAQLIAQVDEALAALPAESRIILTEHFLLGRSQTDLATSAGVNQSTISRRIERGVEELRERLRADGVTAAAIGALPVMLEGAKGTVSPPGLGLALKKIGLSGVHAPAAAAVVSASVLKIAAVSAIVIGGGALMLHQFNRSSGSAPAGSSAGGTAIPASAPIAEKLELDDIIPMEPKLKESEIPSRVKETLNRESNHARLNDVEKRVEKGRTIYEADVRIDGKLVEIRVAEDGTLISKIDAEAEDEKK